MITWSPQNKNKKTPTPKPLTLTRYTGSVVGEIPQNRFVATRRTQRSTSVVWPQAPKNRIIDCVHSKSHRNARNPTVDIHVNIHARQQLPIRNWDKRTSKNPNIQALIETQHTRWPINTTPKQSRVDRNNSKVNRVKCFWLRAKRLAATHTCRSGYRH